MKLRIRLLCTFLCLFTLLGSLPVSAAGSLPFRDVSTSDWFHYDVSYVYQFDLMNGTSNDTFSPDATMTRAMLVTVLYRLDGKSLDCTIKDFKDVADGQWYYDAVRWAAAFEIVNGCSATRFCPDDPITREQLATIFFRYADYIGCSTSERANLSSFKDSGAISSYAKTAMSWANAVGLINGIGDSRIDPQGNATRAQVAAILTRFRSNYLQYIQSDDYLTFSNGVHYTYLKLRKNGVFSGCTVSVFTGGGVTVEYCNFVGKFRISATSDSKTKKLEFLSLRYTGATENFRADNTSFLFTTPPIGMNDTDYLLLYQPEKKVSEIPYEAQGCFGWYTVLDDTYTYLIDSIIYNPYEQRTFLPYSF